ncbi:tcdA/TcdB catalytic glycosyltransferase domain protein, partial [Chlamydia psittaci 84-8471/1]
QI